MIIPNKFIRLEYDPATDILFVEWPNIHDYTVPELRHILSELVKTVRSYDIKKVLADSTRSVVTLPPAEYGAIVDQLTRDLMATRLQKFARLTTGQGMREQAAGKAGETGVGVIQVRNFNDREEALRWLAGLEE